MIRLDSIAFIRGNNFLLENADLTIQAGTKWGLIGSNGCGKSSLFQLLLGDLQVDKGDCQIPKSWKLAHMAQEIHASPQTALDYVLDGDDELREIEKKIAKQTDGNELSKLYEQLEHIGGYTAESRAQQLLFGLGFKSGEDNKTVKDFSGGWRIRLNLAQALMSRADFLLLDEPTNHLDLDASVWLEAWLKNYKGTLLIISHDRDFLDNVVGHIASFENKKLVSYSGNYSSFERQKAERLALQSAAYEKQQQRVKEIENFVRRFRAKATKAKQAQSRLKELERMELIAPAHIDSPFNFRFPQPEKIPQLLLNLDGAELGYNDKALLKGVNFSILAGSRIGLLGHNGAGKSTLMQSLAAMIPLVAGERNEAQQLKIGYFAQHQLEALDLQASAALHLQRLSPNVSEQAIRDFLGGYGFQGDRVHEIIAPFSGGEKARLAIAILAWQKPNLLLLDEPTNHLDLEMCHALTVALQAYEGAMVVISHDRHLLKNTVDEYYLVNAGSVDEFKGDLDDYAVWLNKERLNTDRLGKEPETLNEEATSVVVPEKKQDKKEQRQAAAALREQMKPYTQAIKKLETQMSKIASELSEIEAKLADPKLYEEGNKELPELVKKQGQLKQQQDDVESEWLLKSEELEELFPARN